MPLRWQECKARVHLPLAGDHVEKAHGEIAQPIGFDYRTMRMHASFVNAVPMDENPPAYTGKYASWLFGITAFAVFLCVLGILGAPNFAAIVVAVMYYYAEECALSALSLPQWLLVCGVLDLCIHTYFIIAIMVWLTGRRNRVTAVVSGRSLKICGSLASLFVLSWLCVGLDVMLRLSETSCHHNRPALWNMCIAALVFQCFLFAWVLGLTCK